LTSQPAAARGRASDAAATTAADDALDRSRGRLARWLDAPPWVRQHALSVHHAADGPGATEALGYQRAMFVVRIAGMAFLFGASPLYPVVDLAALAAAGVILGATLVAQAAWLRGDRPPAAWRRFAAAALVADVVVGILVGQTYIANPNWIAFLAYPLLVFEGAVFFGMRGAITVAAVTIVVYEVQTFERAALGHPLSLAHQATVCTLFAIQAAFVGIYAQVSRRVRGDLATLLRLSSLLSHQESPTRIVQALDAHLRELFGARVRSVALRRPDGGYDVLRWRSPETRVIGPDAVATVSRTVGRDLERDFADRRAVTLAIDAEGGEQLTAALGLPDWVRAITLVPIRTDGTQSGILPVLWDTRRVPGLDVLDLLHGLADQTGLAFAQSQLHRARELAATDSLTGLANHRAFQDLLAAHIAEAGRRGDSVSILFCDLDRFKTVNDRHGHAVGDLLLHRIADAIRAAARDGDVVARYGGDELALILPSTDRDGAVEVGRRLRRHVREVDGGMGVDVTVGVAVYPDDATTQPDLLARADAAMYAGKRLGGGRVVDGSDIAADA
jgi:diguanylate cyclase (GGDEF)-like protein